MRWNQIFMTEKAFQKEIDVLAHQRSSVDKLNQDYADLDASISDLEAQVEKYRLAQEIDDSSLENLSADQAGKDPCSRGVFQNSAAQGSDSFDDLLKKAHRAGFADSILADIATQEEIDETVRLLNSYYSEYSGQYTLDQEDYAVAGIIGVMAALMDYFLVTVTSGSSVTSGSLKTGVENFWNKMLSPEKIKDLEKKYKVTYDISRNTSAVSQEILGLCPLYHRYQSLGHDPILGFVFGTADLMKGTAMIIDGSGRLVIQSVSGTEGISFVEAVITVFGHFLSDVGKKSPGGKILSVPAPLMPLLQLIQAGSISYNGKNYNIGDLSKKMYGDGYNFNHFVGMSIPVALIEILTKLTFTIREVFIKGNSFESVKNNPKLTVMLCIASGVLFAENAGKLIITKNPFAINYPAWISMANYGFRTLKWFSYDKGKGEIAHAQSYIDANWKYLEISAESMSSPSEIFIIE